MDIPCNPYDYCVLIQTLLPFMPGAFPTVSRNQGFILRKHRSVPSRAHVPLLLHDTHSMETRLAYLLDQSARSTSHTKAPTTPLHGNTSLARVPDDINQPTCFINASRVSPHAPRSLGQPMMARQTGHVTSRAGRNDGPTTMPSFCSTISSGTSKPMLR